MSKRDEFYHHQMQEFDIQAEEENAVSFEKPDRNSVENDLSAETLVQHLESKLQFQNTEISIQNYDFQTAQQQESRLVLGARDREREHQKRDTNEKGHGTDKFSDFLSPRKN